MPKGLIIALGKPKPSKEGEGPSEDGMDEHLAVAEQMIAAVKAGDAKGLAGILRDCGIGPMMGDDDEY